MSHERMRPAMPPFLFARGPLLGVIVAGVGLLGPSCTEPFSVTSGAGGSTSTMGTGSQGGAGGSGAGEPCADASQCDDGDICTTDTCAKGSCAHAPVADDGDPCTLDACDPMGAVSHTAIDVDDHDVCTADACDAVNGLTHSPVPVDDGNACTVDACNMKTGPFHTPVKQDDGNSCTIDSCDPAKGVQHVSIEVGDGDACTDDKCDPVLGVQHTPIDVDDNDVCTTDSCQPGSGVKHVLIVCDDQDICTTDSCDPVTGCASAPAVYFSEAFANNLQGWTLDPTWQIGPAMASSGQFMGHPDPGVDHTATNDNGVAGVVIGGNIPPAPGPVRYLTSPAIDLSQISGPVVLRFWRWLNIDGLPYVQAYVDVYDGSTNTWVNSWSSSTLVGESAWSSTANGPVPTIFDVTGYKSNNFRFRVGYQVKLVGSFAMSGWNVDDVSLVPSQSCP